MMGANHRRLVGTFAVLMSVGSIFVLSYRAFGQKDDSPNGMIAKNAQDMIDQGRKTFRFDTFGDEAFWGDTLKLHQAIEGSKFGGVGGGVSPKAALAAGLKVDSEALPSSLVDQVRSGQVNLDDPATTLALLKLNAVLCLTG